MPPSITTVCFDLDDTLLEYNQDGDAVIAEAFATVGVDAFCDSEELWACADAVPDADSDHHFLTQTFEIAAERYGGPTTDAEPLASAYEAAIDHTDVSFRPGAETALAHARDHGQVGLVTNGERATQTVKLEALGIHDHFETHVYAGEMTPPKPAREPFDRAVTALGATPERTLYVGNSLKHDVGGAKDAGLQAAWFPENNGRKEPRNHSPDYTFDSLAELKRLL
ncbi:MAG: HAD superfamily hydrolase (TIGR01509 family) [Natronomonas sp.]|jgi:HAD superfamily hydrolase (TIGR01509 family)